MSYKRYIFSPFESIAWDSNQNNRQQYSFNSNYPQVIIHQRNTRENNKYRIRKWPGADGEHDHAITVNTYHPISAIISQLALTEFTLLPEHRQTP